MIACQHTKPWGGLFVYAHLSLFALLPHASFRFCDFANTR